MAKTTNKLHIIKCTRESIDKAPKKPGYLYFTTDTNECFYDIDEENRKRLNTTNIVETVENYNSLSDDDKSISVPSAGKFFELEKYVEDNELVTSAALNDLNDRLLECYTKNEVDETLETKNITIIKSGNTYTFKQGNTELSPVIDIPADLVVSSGQIITLDETNSKGLEAGTYIELTLNDENEDKIYINVNSLTDVYTSGSGITVNDDNTISLNDATTSAKGGVILTDSYENYDKLTNEAKAISVPTAEAIFDLEETISESLNDLNIKVKSALLKSEAVEMFIQKDDVPSDVYSKSEADNKFGLTIESSNGGKTYTFKQGGTALSPALTIPEVNKATKTAAGTVVLCDDETAYNALSTALKAVAVPTVDTIIKNEKIFSAAANDLNLRILELLDRLETVERKLGILENA